MIFCFLKFATLATLIYFSSVASLYHRTRSPFWWVRVFDAKTGKWAGKSTGFRRDDPSEHKKARAVEAELTAREFNRANRCVAGWKGLKLETESEIRDYGESARVRM